MHYIELESTGYEGNFLVPPGWQKRTTSLFMSLTATFMKTALKVCVGVNPKMLSDGSARTGTDPDGIRIEKLESGTCELFSRFYVFPKTLKITALF